MSGVVGMGPDMMTDGSRWKLQMQNIVVQEIVQVDFQMPMHKSESGNGGDVTVVLSCLLYRLVVGVKGASVALHCGGRRGDGMTLM